MRKFVEKTVSRLRQAVKHDVDARKEYPKFDGQMNGTIHPWLPKSSMYSVDAVVVRDHDFSENLRYLAATDTNKFSFYFDGSTQNPDKVGVKYQSGGADTWHPLLDNPIPLNTPVNVGFDFSPAGIVGRAMGQVDAKTDAIPDFPQSPLRYIGGEGGTKWQGLIKKISLKDKSVIQNRKAMRGNATPIRFALFPNIVLPGAFSIDLWYEVRSGGGQYTLVSGDDGTRDDYIVIDQFYNSSTSTIQVRFWARSDGITTTPVLVSTNPLTVGQHVHIHADFDGINTANLYIDDVLVATSDTWTTLNGTEVINRILNRADTYASGCVIADLKIHEKTKGYLYEYDNRNDSGAILSNNSKADKFGLDIFEESNLQIYAPSTKSLTVTGDVIRVTGNGGSDGSSRLFVDKWDSQVLKRKTAYQIEWEYVKGTGNPITLCTGDHNLNIVTDSEVIRSATVAGRYTDTVYLSGTTGSNNFGFKSQSPNNTYFEIRIHAIREVIALATAEGDELWDTSKAILPTDGSNYATLNNDGTVLLEGGAGAIRIPNAAKTGRLYEITVDAEVVTGFLSVTVRDTTDFWYQTNDSTFGYPGQRKKTTFRFFSTKDGSIGLSSRGSMGEVILHSVSLREITHGIWKDSGVDMTDAQADAVRESFDRIDRNYDLSKLPKLKNDPSPLQMGNFVRFNGSSTFARIRDINLTGDFKIDVWWERQDTLAGTTDTHIISDGTVTNRIIVRDTTNPTQPGRLIPVINGITVNGSDNDVGPSTLGKKIHLEVSRTGLVVDRKIGGKSLGTQVLGSVDNMLINRIGDNRTVGVLSVRIKDLTNNEVYHYTNKDDSGLVMYNISKDSKYGVNKASEGLLTTGGGVFTNLVDNGYSISGDCSTQFSRFQIKTQGNSPLVPGKLYELRVKGYSSKTVVAYIQQENSSTGRVSQSALTGEFDTKLLYKPVSSGFLFCIENNYTGANTMRLDYSQCYLREVEYVGTAEGEELLDVTTETKSVPASLSADISGNSVKLTAISSAPYPAINFPNVAIVKDKWYRVKVTIDTRGMTTYPKAFLGIGNGMPTSDERITATGKGVYKFDQLIKIDDDSAPGVRLYLDNANTIPGDYVIFSDISVKETTHGVLVGVDYKGPELVQNPHFKYNTNGMLTTGVPAASSIQWDNGRMKTTKLDTTSTWMARGNQPGVTMLPLTAGKKYVLKSEVYSDPNNATTNAPFVILWNEVTNSAMVSGLTQAQLAKGHTFTAASTGNYSIVLQESIGSQIGDVFYMNYYSLRELNPSAGEKSVVREYVSKLPMVFAKGGDAYTESDYRGVNLVGGVPFQIDSKWTNNNDGSYSLNDPLGAGTNGNLSFASSASFAGKQWLVKFHVDSISDGAYIACANAGFSSGTGAFTAGTTGWHEFIVDGDVNNSVTFKRGLAGVDTVATISNISITETYAIKWAGMTADKREEA